MKNYFFAILMRQTEDLGCINMKGGGRKASSDDVTCYMTKLITSFVMTDLTWTVVIRRSRGDTLKT